MKTKDIKKVLSEKEIRKALNDPLKDLLDKLDKMDQEDKKRHEQNNP